MSEKEVLTKDGKRILFVDAPGNTAATIQVWFKAGSVLEDDSNRGIAHFLEHMFFKGTKKRPGNSLADEVESFGGDINAFTSFDYTCYYINCPKSKIEKSVEILMDLVSNPLFNECDIAPEREVVLEELKRSLDNPNQVSFLKLQSQSFAKDYNYPVIGTLESIKKFNREQLINFRNDHYNKENILIVVAGDVSDKTKIQKIINGTKLPSGLKTSYPKFEIIKKTTIDIHQKDTEMCMLTLCIGAPDYKTTAAPREDLALSILGLGESSRLSDALVIENAIANSASTSTLFMADGSAHLLRVNFPPENIKEVYEILHDVLQKAYIDGANADEIKKIQSQYTASKIYEQESIESKAFTFGNSYVQTDDFYCEQKYIDQLNIATLDEVQLALKNIMKREIHFNLQIPKHQKVAAHKTLLTGFAKRITTISKNADKKKTKISGIKKSKFDEQVKIVEIVPGVKLLHRYNALTPTFASQIYIKGGLTEENTKNNGIHSMLAGLLHRGHKNATDKEITNFLENHSASMYGFAGKNAYGMVLHGLVKDSDQLFDHFFKSFFEPTIPEDIYKRELKLTKRAILASKKDPVKCCFEHFSKLVFNKHPYALDMIGTAESVALLSASGLKKRHYKNLKEKDILITICGDITFENAYNICIEKLKNVKPRDTTEITVKPTKPIFGKRIFIPFDREQTHILMGFSTTPSRNKDSIYLKMLTSHLSGQSSELFSVVRDQLGLCYTAQPVNFLAYEAAYFGIYMACGNDKVEAAIVAIKNIINNIAENGITREEFQKIKTTMRGTNEMSLQTNDDYASNYSVPFLQGLGVDYFYTDDLAIQKLDYNKFSSKIKEILRVDSNIIVVGKSKDCRIS